MINYKTDILIDSAYDLGIEINNQQVNRFLNYYTLLIEWNKAINLTSIIDFEEVVLKHFIDSLSLIKLIDLKQDYTIIDIGTGAGFPGIPLCIIFPHLSITLLDSLNKRVRFLDEVINQLELDNIRTIHGRAEDYARDLNYREKYDLAISRAVANLSTLSEYCLPFIKVDGLFISYKSEKIQEEYLEADKAIQILGGEYHKQVDFLLPNTDIYRNLFSVKKLQKTDNKYPRKSGLPSKKPL